MKAYGWSLHDINETDIDSLFAFTFYDPEKATDNNTRIIDGNISRRVKEGAPSWL